MVSTWASKDPTSLRRKTQWPMPPQPNTAAPKLLRCHGTPAPTPGVPELHTNAQWAWGQETQKESTRWPGTSRASLGLAPWPTRSLYYLSHRWLVSSPSHVHLAALSEGFLFLRAPQWTLLLATRGLLYSIVIIVVSGAPCGQCYTLCSFLKNPKPSCFFMIHCLSEWSQIFCTLVGIYEYKKAPIAPLWAMLQNSEIDFCIAIFKHSPLNVLVRNEISQHLFSK